MPKIGLVGYNCRSGLGEVNRQLASYADVDLWLVRPHRYFPTAQDHPNVDTLHCPTGIKVPEFLKRIDVVLFVETPYYLGLAEQAKALGKRVVCVPMQEWMPESNEGWVQHVDLFVCPTRYCYDQFRSSLPCVYYPWPVDTERFTGKLRTTIHKFLYCNGNGGYQGRKGWQTIREAVSLWPEMPLCVHSQRELEWGFANTPNVEFLPPPIENIDLYEQGDVLLCPHKCDGLGLEPLEALASGLPVIVTEGAPWNEIPAIARIQASKGQNRIKRMVDWYTPNAQSLVNLCQGILGLDIKEASRAARAWAESRSWSQFGSQLTSIIKCYDPTSGAIK